MQAKDLKDVVAMAKLISAYPVDHPHVVYDRGTWWAYNLRDTGFQLVGPQDGVEACFSLRSLTKVCSRLKASDEVTVREQSLEVGATSYSLGYPAVLPQDYPELPIPEDLQVAGQATFPFAHVVPMMYPDADRPHLNAVQLETSPEGLMVVTTDGHRMAHRSVPGDFPEGSFLVPGSAMAPLLRLPAELTFAWGRQGAAFVSGPWRVYCQEVTERFPPWRKILPREHAWTATVDRAALVAALRRVDVAPTAALLVSQAEGGLHLKQEDADGFGAAEVVPATVRGDVPSFGVCLRYLLDAVIHTAGDPVELSGMGTGDSISVGGDNIVMPMRL